MVEYSRDQVNDLINANMQIARLESLQEQNKINWQSLQRDLSDQAARMSTISDRIQSIDRTFHESRAFVTECKIDLEEKMKGNYVTHEQLDMSLERFSARLSNEMSAQLGGRLDAFATRLDAKYSKMDDEIKETRDSLRRLVHIITGVALTFAAIAGVMQFANNTVTTANQITELKK